MLKKLSIALLGLTAVVMSSNPASAITLKVNAGPFSSYSDAKTVTFDDGTAKDPNGFVTYSNITDNIVIGSKSGQYAAPYGDDTKYLTIAPVGSGVAGSTGFVTLDFKEAIDYFGFYAGSLDSYNFVDIYSGGKLLKSFSGSDVPTAIADGSWTSKEANMFINLVGENGEKFDRVVMRTNGIAFETDNHSYRLANRSVPEPNAMLGLLAIGAFGATSVVKGLKDKTVKD
ncbi:PEP-CTERM sorting domain-containing protein [Nostoc sp. CENA543]|uniref:Npun_F0296 family exosortase-dependent surface protein n=1 Tax=Nostoc sp. CENA543 TaxID=1869241 RepID=UPI000CA3B351|nr:PEP-CTERM sorting domain-containing protein [Nostoc sp. CENA543]AUT00800.1 PEP-CTERM sorting domain-containing protein [Nostoc sp. CENA543]